MPERSFGRTVRYRRTKLGLSQAELGELVGRSPSTVRSWERDKSAPTEIGVLHALAAVLGVDERSLFEKAGQDPPPVLETSPTVEEALASLRPTLEDEQEVVQDHRDGEPQDAPEEEPEHIGRIEPDPAEEGDSNGLEQMSIFAGQDDEIESGSGGDPVIVPAIEDQPRPGYVAPPEPYVVTPATPPIVEPSYVEDQGQRQLYRARNLATLVVVVALVIALLWALSESLDAFGSWWDQFFGSLRF